MLQRNRLHLHPPDPNSVILKVENIFLSNIRTNTWYKDQKEHNKPDMKAWQLVLKCVNCYISWRFSKFICFFKGAVLWTRKWTSSDSAWRSCRKTDVCHTTMGISHKPTKSIDMENFPHTSHLYWLDADREYRGETQVHIVWWSFETILKLTNEVIYFFS